MASSNPFFFLDTFSVLISESQQSRRHCILNRWIFGCARHALNWTSSFVFQYLWFCQVRASFVFFSTARISRSVGWLDIFHLRILHICSLIGGRSVWTCKAAFSRRSRNQMCLQPCGFWEYGSKALRLFCIGNTFLTAKIYNLECNCGNT